MFIWFKETLCLREINKLKRNNPIFAYLDQNEPMPQEAQDAYTVVPEKGSKEAMAKKSSQEQRGTVHKSVPRYS